MSDFDCPRCGKLFDHEALLAQEANMFEFEDAILTVNCSNCGESFEVVRIVELSYRLTAASAARCGETSCN
jgi:transcription elongation factor Elf1